MVKKPLAFKARRKLGRPIRQAFSWHQWEPQVIAMSGIRVGSRMPGEGIFADQISRMFEVASRKAGLDGDGPELSTAAFRRPGQQQLDLAL